MTKWQFYKHFTCKVLSKARSTHSFAFQVCWMPNTELGWEDVSTFNGKCVVITENFKCNLLTVSLINFISMDWRTILRKRAFQQYICSIIGVSFHETAHLNCV